MVEVSDTLMAQHLIAEALEVGEFDMPMSIGLGEYGQYDREIEWDIGDLDPESCDVFMSDDSMTVAGEIEASYSIQTSSGNRHHPPEYKHKEETIYVTITRTLGDMSSPEVRGEFV